VSTNYFNARFPARPSILKLLLPVFLAACLPWSSLAQVSTTLTWSPSSDPGVAGYNIYYGCTSHQYTNMIAVGLVTNVVISGLTANVTYYFAATARDSQGNESAYSNEAAFSGASATPDSGLRYRAAPKNPNGDPLIFSLDATAPPGATINPTNGLLSWTPGHGYAMTTNYIDVIITDTANPALSISETLVVVVGDFLDLQLGATATAAGQMGYVPLTVAASSSVTNIQVTLNWPGSQLLNPTLTFAAPIVAGSLQSQGNQLIIQLQTAPDQPLLGTNLVAQVNFQAAPSPASAIFSLPASAASGTAIDGTAYANVTAQPGEVVVVGDTPLLRPQVDPVNGRTLSLYANPGTYQLLYTTSLLAPVTWSTLMTYEQTNVAQTVSLDSSNPAVFYQLQQL
jgi:hypothetical protein